MLDVIQLMWQTARKNLFYRGGTILLLAITLLVLNGCKQNRTESEENTIQWQPITYHQVTPFDSRDSTKGEIEQDYSLLFPQDNPKLQGEICRVLLGGLENNLDPRTVLDSLASSNRQHDVQKGAQDESLSYHERLHSFLAYTDAQVVSLAVVYTFTTRGNEEHPTLCYYNFYLPEGKAFSESSLFIDGYEAPLTKLLTQAVETQANGEIVNYDEIRPNGNFMVNATGITYCFPEHAVVVDHKGELNVSLSWQELRPLLKEKSPIQHFLS